MSAGRKIKLAVFMMMDGNYHLAGWRLPRSHADAGCNVAHWIEFAQILERGFREHSSRGLDDRVAVEVVVGVDLVGSAALRELAHRERHLPHADDRADVVEQARFAVAHGHARNAAPRKADEAGLALARALDRVTAELGLEEAESQA